MTLEEIGEKFSLTRERVRQIKEKSYAEVKTKFAKQDIEVLPGVGAESLVLVLSPWLDTTPCAGNNCSRLRISRLPNTNLALLRH